MPFAIFRYDQSGKAEKLTESKERQKSLLVSLGRKEKEQEEITQNVNALTEELANQQVK